MLETITLLSTLTVGNIMEHGQADTICKKLNVGDTITLDSGGGILEEFLELGECIYQKDINVILKQALSSAGYTATASKNTCIYKDSVVGYHATHYIIEGYLVELSVAQHRKIISDTTQAMVKWGLDAQTAINIAHTAMMTHPKLMFKFVGDDIRLILNNVTYCKEESIGKQ